ncbi:hypothetical protein JK361_32835 [Streptomyces sp. 5-8]|uniref:Uncharacterized protein n=1 Tax=Streptomyces musisoli TaxID=2802280 RepID=A0ABS1PAE4_9ACTN|nr:hypothetical protein [Streptomyces musisoli]MBL1109323.1 hypothetical protein [Streptomyces musisoli]
MDIHRGRLLVEARFQEPLRCRWPSLLASLPLGLTPLFLGDPSVGEVQLPRGVLLDDGGG